MKNEINVAIGRNGEIIHNCSGTHRIVLAYLLGIDKVPAIVNIWHKKYIDKIKKDKKNITPKTAIETILDEYKKSN